MPPARRAIFGHSPGSNILRSISPSQIVATLNFSSFLQIYGRTVFIPVSSQKSTSAGRMSLP